MKSKLIMLISIATLTLASSAMAATKPVLSAARGPVSVSKNARAAVTKKSASRTALPQPHTILNGAKNNF